MGYRYINKYEKRRRVKIVEPIGNRVKKKRKRCKDTKIFRAARTKYPYRKSRYYGKKTNNSPTESKFNKRRDDLENRKYKPTEYWCKHSSDSNESTISDSSGTMYSRGTRSNISRSYSEFSTSSSG